MSALHIPLIAPEDDVLAAAFKYANAGWYVLPVKMSTKHPGSVVGNHWQDQSSRDPKVLTSWYAGTSGLGIALHQGRSGAVAVDVDAPELMPDMLAAACVRTVHQSTRDNVPDRGHYLFAMPPGRNIGNSNGKLGKDWGEIRGKNGVVIVEPSSHEKSANGGRYQWVTTGPLLELPADVAALLPDGADAQDAATDAQVSTFLTEHTTMTRPELVDVWCALFTKEVDAGASRHQSMVSKLAGAMKEGRAGLIDARTAADTLEGLFLTAIGKAPKGKQGDARSGAFARNEWAGLLSWAVAQALAADVDGTRARVAEKAPKPRELHQLEQVPAGVDPNSEAVADTTQEATGAALSADLLSWAPVDLSAYLDGSYTPAVPTLLARTDGVCLLYPGHVHSLHGESESGKSLVAQYLAAQQIMAGRAVLFIDFESDAATVTERLLMLGATPEAIKAHFHYIRPEVDPRSASAELPAWHAMLSRSYVLAVIDGVTDSLGVFGFSTKDNDEVATWMRVLPKNVAKRTGAAVAVIDHVTKDNDSRGRFAIGAQAKMSGLTGAGYTVEVIEALGRGLRGVIVLRVGKDRPGHVRGHSGPMRKSDRTQETARVVVDSTLDPDHPVITVEPWRGSDGLGLEVRPFRLTGFMEKISHALEASTEPTSFRGIDALVSGKQAHIVIALDALVSEGYVTRQDGPRKSKMHASVTAYRQALDPQSDMFKGGETVNRPERLSTVSRPYTGGRETDTQPSPETVGETVGDSQRAAS